MFSDVLEYLISCGCRVSEVAGSSGSTALHYSVSGGHEGCVRVLVQYGADVNPLMTSEEVYDYQPQCHTQKYCVSWYCTALLRCIAI